jgi:all-trans-retinol 13,14-reductase
LELLPAELRESDWAREVASLHPSACHIGLYLGFHGDTRDRGATSSNHWFYETLDIADTLWRDPANEPIPPSLYVTFPSLKLPANDLPGTVKHTAEVVTFTDWKAFARWETSRRGQRPADYRDLKAKITGHLLAQFAHRFPALAPLIAHTELSTPLSSVAFVGAEHGGVYGLEASPRRFLSNCLNAKTPIPGLYLTGQDVGSTGLTGAMMGGVLSAATVEPRVLAHVT